MRAYIGGQEVTTDQELAELALGTPLDLWIGVEGESPQERAARIDAARDILTEDPELFDRVWRVALRTPGAVQRLRPFVPTARRIAAEQYEAVAA